VKLLVFLAATVLANAQASTNLQFEVATIKPTDHTISHTTGIQIYPGGRLVIPVAMLKGLIATAFNLSYWQISGGDSWITKDEYDIEAKPSENITNLRHSLFGIEDPRLREMLQAFLIDRFQLTFHRETKTGKVYLLQRKGALKLRPTAAPSDPDHPQRSAFSGDIGFAQGRWAIFNTSMPQLAKYAADRVVHAPVSDETGLSGSFDYRQPVTLQDSEVSYSDPYGTFLLLIPELGLKLEPARGPVEIFVIDHAAKPSSN
jgi:uncharacterized protein (TIGR03435 family)